ncbi:hypothetical protein MRX96_030581 [Rhipicephalus microplus]
MYLLIVPFARYVSFELRAASRRSFLPDSMMARLCIRYLYAMFGPSAHATLMQVMGTDKAASSYMWNNIRQQSQALRYVGTGFKLSRDALLNATLKSHNTRGSKWSSAPICLPTENEAEVATELLVPDFYYNDSTEASINYGTLGGHMARMLFDAAFPEKYSSKYVGCLDEFTVHNAIPFDKTDWQRYVNMQWSMNASFESLQRERETARSSLLHQRLFFLRYAMSICGEDTSAVKSLQYAARTSLSFATAFNCYRPPKNPCT